MPQSPSAVAGYLNPSNQAAQGRVDAQAAALVAQRHGPNYEAALAASIGIVSNANGAVGRTTSISLATTYTGLCLSNPAASGKNLVLLNVAGAIMVAPSAVTYLGLIAGYAAGGVTVHTTALTPLQALLGNATALVAKADAAATLVGTPAWVRALGVTPTATGFVSFDRDIAGGIIIPPGGYVAIGTDIAGPAAGLMASMVWEEVTA